MSNQDCRRRLEGLLAFAGLLAESSVIGAESSKSALRRHRILFRLDLLGQLLKGRIELSDSNAPCLASLR
jgi:hypothetical protein